MRGISVCLLISCCLYRRGHVLPIAFAISMLQQRVWCIEHGVWPLRVNALFEAAAASLWLLQSKTMLHRMLWVPVRVLLSLMLRMPIHTLVHQPLSISLITTTLHASHSIPRMRTHRVSRTIR